MESIQLRQQQFHFHFPVSTSAWISKYKKAAAKLEELSSEFDSILDRLAASEAAEKEMRALTDGLALELERNLARSSSSSSS